ncbi:hypothetical protein QFC21_005966 [Naganishia friedmannii]|uniref:Uncharacterized protein n=1 Tax=Naganishia friedmannii TaxID=89922 RepID=A0ACC2V758_9TREE|nr:hypothetical protein QFC21_005966 [Naganishia friedmannii]
MQGTIAGKLPPNLLKLFAPRPPPPFFKPVGKDPEEPGPNKLQGVAAVVQRLKEEEEDRVFKRDTAGQGTEGEAVEKKFTLALEYQKQLRKEEAKKQKEEYKKNLEKNYNPNEDPAAVGDPYKTLFISRLSKKTTEEDLRREFEMYGKIERIRIVQDKKGKSKSYAFVVYERERDMKAAYKDAEGIPIHHKKILVDVERGRTVKGWKPRKLGGGLGGRPKPVDPAAVAPPPVFQPEVVWVVVSEALWADGADEEVEEGSEVASRVAEDSEAGSSRDVAVASRAEASEAGSNRGAVGFKEEGRRRSKAVEDLVMVVWAVKIDPSMARRMGEDSNETLLEQVPELVHSA